MPPSVMKRMGSPRTLFASSRSISSSSDKSPSSLSHLIASEKWKALRVLLASEAGREELDTQLDSEDSLSEDNILHYACQHHPPLDVIKLLARKYKSSLFHTNNLSRYPIHIAAKWGASPTVISFLSERNPAAAGWQDSTGKTPLHLVCENYVERYSEKKEAGLPLKEAMLEVVRTISRAAPSCVNLEDMDDMSALEYAIESGADYKVVRDLQKRCEKDWKKKKAALETPSQAGTNGQEDRVGSDRSVMEIVNATATLSTSDGSDMNKKVSLSQPMPPLQRPKKSKSARALTA